jgi:hypothetical protein
MNCPEHLLLEAFKGRLWIWVYYYDVPRSEVPLMVWLNPLRWQVTLSFGDRAKVINRGGKANTTISNFLYKYIRPKICKWFGIHQRFDFVGGEKQCHHCNVGKEDHV